MNKQNHKGEIGYTNNGHYKMTIVDYINNRNVTVEFEDGSQKTVTYQRFRQGEVSFENRYNNQIFPCVNGGYVKIIERKKGNPYCLVEFDNVPIQRGYVYYGNLAKGLVKNPWQPSICNIGYIGKIFDQNNPITKNVAYTHWSHMIQRCYDSKNHKYRFYGAKGVKVCEEWLCFANYEKWFNNNYYEIPNCDMIVDKDILYKNCKLYSPTTCSIIPSDINKLFCNAKAIRGQLPLGVTYHKINHNYIATITKCNKRIHLGCFNTPQEAFRAYKIAKEQYIKEMADKYREYLPQKIYDAMYNYQVDITD